MAVFPGQVWSRPGLQQLLANIRESLVDTVVVCKVDRLTRSLTDFARMVELFDAKSVSFVAVTQQFNTHHLDGAADAQRAAVVCAVLVRGDRRTNPRQGRRLQAGDGD
jgi:DNA invertase Pin-like site-specific DNA recombinase